MMNSITKKFGLVLMVFTLAGIAALGSFSRLYVRQNEARQSRASARAMMTFAREFNAYVNLIGTEQEKHQASVLDGVQSFESEIQAMKNGGRVGDRDVPAETGEARQVLLEIEQLWPGLKAGLQFIASKPSGAPESAGAILHLRTTSPQITDALKRIMVINAKTREKLQRESTAVLALILLLDAGMILSCLWLAKRRIVAPLVAMETAARRIQAGDFSHRISLNSNDEIGTLAGALNNMSASIQTLLVEKTESAQALAASESRYHLLFDSNPHSLWVYDVETLHFLTVNDATVKLYGYSREEFLGMTIRDICPPKDLGRFSGYLAKESRGFEQSATWPQLKKDGSIIEVEIAPHDVSFGGKRAQLVLVTDVTEKKSLEAQLLRAQRMESIGTLAAGIAHDLNNVLSPIVMAIRLLKEAFPGEKEKMMLATVERSAKRGADLVRQVLTFARGIKGERVAVQFQHVIREVKQIADETFPKTINITTDVAVDLASISGDPTQLHQVLMNLCVTARDAMPDGGALRIAVSNVLLGEDYARTHIDARSGAYVLIQISDSGVGMPANVIDRIFEPFFTTKEFGKGTGLGLSTTLAIVKSHGGFINVYSDYGHGTKFNVYLPVSSTAKPANSQSEQRLPRGRGEYILLIDDEASVRDITTATLEAHGYRVLPANNGAEGIARYAQNKDEIKAVIVDMAMPVMDGPTTIASLRKKNPELPIIATSGLIEDSRLEALESSGAIKAFLPKPCGAEQILTTVRNVLNTVLILT